MLIFLAHAGAMKRLKTFDGVRGLLAVYVVLGHMAPLAVLPDWLQTAVSHGGAAVDLFFALSGLVISQSLLRANGAVWPFLIARGARIFPVFLVVFAFAVAVQPWSCGFEHMPWISPDNAARTICVTAWPHRWVAEIVAHLTMTHGLFPTAVLPDVWVSFLGAAWSLSTEWQFYLLALYAAARGRPLCWILLALAVAGLGWHWATPEAWQFSRPFLPNRAHFFALGVASASVVRLQANGPSRLALGRYVLVLFAVMAICAAQGTFGKMLPPLIWTFFLMVHIWPEAVGIRFFGLLLRSKVASYLGAISYCLYLVNEPIQKVAASTLAQLAGDDSAWFTALWIPASLSVPLLVSAWLHAHLEAPALRWGRLMAERTASRRVSTSVQACSGGL